MRHTVRREDWQHSLMYTTEAEALDVARALSASDIDRLTWQVNNANGEVVVSYRNGVVQPVQGELMALIVVDCEAPMGVGAPSVGDMTEFGAVEVFERPPTDPTQAPRRTFYGVCTQESFVAFDHWLKQFKGRPIFVSDNPAYDWQWINYYFWKYLGRNPFGHSARRISDFYAGLTGDFANTQAWKALRVTPHDHHPVNDAMGNAEALERLMSGERPGVVRHESAGFPGSRS